MENRTTAAESEVDELMSEVCRSCGACCYFISGFDLEPGDLDRLCVGVDRSKLAEIGWLHEVDGDCVFDTTAIGRCCFLARQDGTYSCTVYERRPSRCASHQCRLSRAVRSVLLDNGDRPRDMGWVHRCGNIIDLRREVLAFVPEFRESILYTYRIFLMNGAKFDRSESFEALINIGGA